MRQLCIAGCALFLASVALAAAEHHQSSTPQEVFDAMQANFHPASARGVHVRYQFNLTGPKGGSWWIEVNDGKCRFGKGTTANPDVTFVASDVDWVALSNNKLNGVWAYMTGRLKIRGPHSLARKLDEMF